MSALLLPAAATAEPVAQDPGGDRIEIFLWANQSHAPNEPIRHCSQDRIWCAEFGYSQARGSWEVQVFARRTNRVPMERRWHYALPAARWRGGRGHGATLWAKIVRDSWDGALVGIELVRTDGGRPGFFSNQRRLLLIHIPSMAGVAPSVVLETPLSGYIEQSVCPYPELPPGLVSDEDDARIAACQDQFSFSTLFTLLPSSQPEDQPPDLIVAAIATTAPGRRPRTERTAQRAPIERTEGDIVRDPACTFTRSYYFDAAQGRYVPDAPLPACRDYLEP